MPYPFEALFQNSFAMSFQIDAEHGHIAVAVCRLYSATTRIGRDTYSLVHVSLTMMVETATLVTGVLLLDYDVGGEGTGAVPRRRLRKARLMNSWQRCWQCRLS